MGVIDFDLAVLAKPLSRKSLIENVLSQSELDKMERSVFQAQFVRQISVSYLEFVSDVRAVSHATFSPESCFVSDSVTAISGDYYVDCLFMICCAR